MGQKDSGGMRHEGKIRSNLGEMDSLQWAVRAGRGHWWKAPGELALCAGLLTSAGLLCSAAQCVQRGAQSLGEVAPASQCW